MKEKIKKIMENTWKMFCEYYDCQAPKYSKPLGVEEAKDSHWICWNEYDLMIQFGRFFYKKLDKINSNIEMHLERNLNYSFRGFDFDNKLEELKKNLGRFPKVDLIIASEDSVGSFLMCGEAKYFHYSVEAISRGRQTVEEVIKKDIKTLSKIKDLGIAENVAFIIFDDYYYLNEPEKCKKIKNLLEQHKKKIKILYHNSRAKLK